MSCTLIACRCRAAEREIRRTRSVARARSTTLSRRNLAPREWPRAARPRRLAPSARASLRAERSLHTLLRRLADSAFAGKLAANKQLMNRMKSLRGEYIRVDGDAVTFLWSGSETDYSGMIMDHGGYAKMLNAIMDDLADIADAVPQPSA